MKKVYEVENRVGRTKYKKINFFFNILGLKIP